MARKARGDTICPFEIQIVHVSNRCVRRAHLCGYDAETNTDFDYRRQWCRDRVEHLASCFSIDVVTFSIMNNHTHQVLRTRPDVVASFSDEEVVRRWLRISAKLNEQGQPKEATQKRINKELLNPERVAELRKRLSDVSWWMRYFSQYISCRCNQEDGVTGHFWEERFWHEVLASESQLLACMIYVDLNPVRAQMAATPEESDYTGAKERIDDLRIAASLDTPGNLVLSISGDIDETHQWERLGADGSAFLSPIEIREKEDPIGPDIEPGGKRASRKGVLGMSLTQYLKLLDFSGRILRGDKRGSIDSNLDPIMQRLPVSPKRLVRMISEVGKRLGHNFHKATKIKTKIMLGST